MRRLREKLFTYADGIVGTAQPTRLGVQDIRRSDGVVVKDFRSLIKIAAHLQSAHRGHMLFFRGQTMDFRDRNQRSNLYPTLFRSGPPGLKKEQLAERWQKLDRAVRAVIRERHQLGLPAKSHLHLEPVIALLQHYQLADTPLLDVTPSLRVAASFALPNPSTTRGVVYVLALPYPHGAISHFVSEDMVLVRLLGVCPHLALRPHHQEGYLVGKFPISSAGTLEVQKEPNDNAASRLVAKIQLDDGGGDFFNPDFPRFPESALLPALDPFGELLRQVVAH